MIELVTKVSRTIDNDITIPAGTKGGLLDIIIEDEGRRVLILLEFDEYPLEWYSPDELEEKY